MAASKASKQRAKRVREGKLDPAVKRRGWSDVQPLTRVTPTLEEKRRRQEHKHKRNAFPYVEDGSVCYFPLSS